MAAYRNNANVTGHAADVADVDMQEHISTVDHAALQHSQPHGLSCYSVIFLLHSVSKKRLTCYNLDTHNLIITVFGRSVTEKVRNQMMLCFPTSPI